MSEIIAKEFPGIDPAEREAMAELVTSGFLQEGLPLWVAREVVQDLLAAARRARTSWVAEKLPPGTDKEITDWAEKLAGE